MVAAMEGSWEEKEKMRGMLMMNTNRVKGMCYDGRESGVGNERKKSLNSWYTRE